MQFLPPVFSSRVVGLTLSLCALEAFAGDTLLGPPSLVIDDFDRGKTVGLVTKRKNSVGQYHGTFSQRPSYAKMGKSGKYRRGLSGYSLRLDFDTRGGGWAGYHNTFGGLDVSRYNGLSFWVKGAKGQETFDIGFLDQAMQENAVDSMYIGSVQMYLEDGITRKWQEVVIPLCAIDRAMGGLVNFARAGGIVFSARNKQKSTVWVEDIEFKKFDKLEHDYLCTHKDKRVPLSSLKEQAQQQQQQKKKKAKGGAKDVVPTKKPDTKGK